jgi:hypothetical protein
MRARDLIPAIVLAVGADAAGSQSISGRVVDADSRAPVARAEVILTDSTARELRRIESDSTGGFFLRLTAEGSYVLRVSHLAYARYASDPVEVGPAEGVTLEIRMGRTAIPLEPIVVTARSSTRMAEFHQRRLTNAFGRFMTEEEIDRRSPLQTSDLLRGVAGIALSPVRTRGRTITRITLPSSFGRCEPAFWVDGVRLSATGAPVDDVLSPETVAGIEVYSSTAGAPAQYADSRGCGTILFWTRTGERDEGRAFSWKRTMIGLGGALLVVLLIR